MPPVKHVVDPAKKRAYTVKMLGGASVRIPGGAGLPAPS